MNNMNERTPEETAAIEKDIEKGLREIAAFIGGVINAMPIAVSNLHPHATSTRKVLAAFHKLVEAKQDLLKAVEGGVTVKKKGN